MRAGAAVRADIVELRWDDAALVAQAVDVENESSALDAPWSHPETPTSLRGRLRYGWDLEPSKHVAVLVGDRMVAWGSLELPTWDNLDAAWLELRVRPADRRAGHGTQLFEHLEAMAVAEGRPKIGSDAWESSPGEVFANRFGLTRKSQAINRRQHLDELDLDDVRRRYAEAEAAASAYELVRVVGRTPDELLPGVAQMAASINDAPLDDLDIEDEQFPPQRIRDYETAALGRGQRLYRLLARHRGTGELAGHTVVAVEEERPHRGDQHDTAVAGAHRGHRLGLLLKAGMNLWLADEEPQLRTIDTWNAESNGHMIAVNEALGYRWMGRVLEFQR